MTQNGIKSSGAKDIVLGITFNEKAETLISLNRDKQGVLQWMCMGGKTDDLSPEEALIKEFNEEIKRPIQIIGLIGTVHHTDKKGMVNAKLLRMTIKGDLDTLKSQEPDNIVRCHFMSLTEFVSIRKKTFDGYPVSRLTFKILSSLTNLHPWKGCLKKQYRNYIITC